MANSGSETPLHVPVLLDEVANALVWRKDGTYVDGTLGDGGHCERIVGMLSEGGRVIGIDRDPVAHERSAVRLAPWRDRVIQRQATFGEMVSVLDDLNISQVSGVLLDLGISSMQIDAAERGFSFRHTGPLDMRMGPDTTLSAADIVNTWSERDIAHVLRTYGEEKRAISIARNIVRARPIKSTDGLVAAIGPRGPERAEKSLARVFQALRIAVNGELDQLEKVLNDIVDRIEIGGRIVVIAYHSLEDRIVKRWMRLESTECICPASAPVCVCDHHARLRLISRRAITPRETEIRENPRARSAKMRVAERISVSSETKR